jgi:hypothetical protein
MFQYEQERKREGTKNQDRSSLRFVSCMKVTYKRNKKFSTLYPGNLFDLKATVQKKQLVLASSISQTS